MLRCSTCSETKAADEFAQCSRSKSGRQWNCRSCQAIYYAAWRSAQKQTLLSDAPADAPDMANQAMYSQARASQVRTELARDPPSTIQHFRPLTEEEIRERLRRLKAYEASRKRAQSSKLIRALRVRSRQMFVEQPRDPEVVASDGSTMDTDGGGTEASRGSPVAPATTSEAPSEVDHLYLLRYPWDESPIKVGRAHDVDARVRNLERGHNFKLQQLAIFPGQGWLERRVHTLLSDHRATDGRGQEWFHVTLEQAASAVTSAIALANQPRP